MTSRRTVAASTGEAWHAPPHDGPGRQRKTMPAVLNIRDCPGHEVPAGAVYIGRGVMHVGYRLVKSKWANPFSIPNKAMFEQREHALASYERWLCDKPELMAALPEL